MENVQELFQSARDHQAAGNVDGAIRLYEETVSREPNHAGALHALGVLMNRRADYRRAAALLEQAVVLRPSDPAFHVELAEGYRNLGAYRDAIGCCITGLRLRPEYPEAWNTLGLAIRGAGDIEGALERFLRAIACREDFFAAHVNAGQALMELGRIDQAIPHFRRAVELAPDSCQARTSLGLALSDRGQNEEALPHLEEAARLGPDLGVAHHNVGNCLRLLGRTVEARASYLRAIRIDPVATLSYLHVGITLRLEGSLHDALRWYKLAVEMEPDNPHLWEELADLHQKRDEPDEAVSCRRRVLDLSPADIFGARVDLGWALQEAGQSDEALEQYRIALDTQPNAARVHLALCIVHEELGDMVEAEARAREAIRLQPGFPAAYARLTTLLRGKCPDDDLRVIESLLSDPGVGQQPRTHLLFALALVLDARRRFPEAASCLSEANALTLETSRGEGVVYDPEHHKKFVDGLIRAFDRHFFGRVAGLGLETTRPVFVVGLPRSGTTLVEQILASHGRIHGAGERMFGWRMFEKLPSVTGRREAPMACVEHLDEHALKLLAGEHLGKLNAVHMGRHERTVDKLPDNYLYIGLLVAMFPQATFIHCRRDLRNVAVSCWMADFRTIRWANDPMHIGTRFQQYRRLMAHWSHAFPAPLIEIDYEDTVSDLEAVARRLIEACGFEWDPACLDFHTTRRIVRTASLTQVRQPIYKSSVARWKNYENELADLFAMLCNLRDDDPGRTACEGPA